MRIIIRVFLASMCATPAVAEEFGAGFSTTTREAWNSSRLVGAPDPPSPFRTERVYPKLRFDEPLAARPIPGSKRFCVAQRYGRLLTFTDDKNVDRADLLIDVGKHVLGITFSPKHQASPNIYISYIIDKTNDSPRKVRVSRFTVDPGDPPRCRPETERTIIEWESLYHDGGCLAFGNDGFLYVSSGDGGGADNGQGLGDLSSSILRIDVNGTGDGPYAIPAGNPFVGSAGARPEVWAYGLRMPWRFSIDRSTGDLWVGDVGQDLWEMIYRVERGGNYGWNVTEGRHPYRPARKQGPTPILPPIVEHSHAEARSITGGYVYRGARLKLLIGAYVYGDYDTGKVWGLRVNAAGEIQRHEELVDTNLRIVSFSEDFHNDILLLDHMGGGIHRLAPAPAERSPSRFPRKLSETGLFDRTADLKPAPGLIPYSVNAPLWSDGAEKERYLAIPGTGRIELDGITFPEDRNGRGPFGWKFPDGSALVKTFFLETIHDGKPVRRRLETRVLHHERLVGTEEVGDQFWRGYTYIWNDEQTDAELLEGTAGLDRAFNVKDLSAPGGSREQVWHFPSRSECMTCHTMPAKFVLGMNTLQMNREHSYNDVKENQIRVFEKLGLFDKPLPMTPEEMPRLAAYEDIREPLENRARSYLHANCSHCHRGFGGGNSDFQLIYTLGLEETGIIRGKPTRGDLGIPGGLLIAPGLPERSLILERVNRIGEGRMPPLSSGVRDDRAVELLRGWIESLAK